MLPIVIFHACIPKQKTQYDLSLFMNPYNLKTIEAVKLPHNYPNYTASHVPSQCMDCFRTAGLMLQYNC